MSIYLMTNINLDHLVKKLFLPVFSARLINILGDMVKDSENILFLLINLPINFSMDQLSFWK